MFINFISEIIHATKFFKSPSAEIEKLKTENLTVETLNVTDTALVHNKLTVEKELVVDDKATIKTAEITEDAVVKKDLSVEKNLEVKERATIKNASIATANIDDVHKDSKVWSGDVSTLVTDAHEYGLTNQENRNWNGSGTKVSRSNHTHKIPNAIKNPNTLTIYEYSKSAEDHKGKAHAYDGSPCTSGDKMNDNGDTGFIIDYNFVGASPKSHTSTTGNTYGQATDKLFGHTKLYTFDTTKMLDEDGNPDEDKTAIYTDFVSSMGVMSGTALTPASLSSYAGYMSKYMEKNFVKKVVDKEGNLTLEGSKIRINGTLEVLESIKLGSSGYIRGEKGESGEISDIITIYSAKNPATAKLRLGVSDTAPIITSTSDGHLYIGHDTYVSKLSDYEIERVITGDSGDQYKKWVPSREGMYRIYMIGGSGFGGAGLALWDGRKGDSIPNNLRQSGYGTGEVFPGFGGCGAPVVIVDLVTRNQSSSMSQTSSKKFRVLKGEYTGGALDVKAYFRATTVDERPGGKGTYYSGTITFTDFSTGRDVNCYDKLTEDPYCNGATATAINAIIIIDAQQMDGLTATPAVDSTDDNPVWDITGNYTMSYKFTSFPCSLQGTDANTNPIDEDMSYVLEDIEFTELNITFEVKPQDSDGDTSDDSDEDDTDDSGESTEEGETGVGDPDAGDSSSVTGDDNNSSGVGVTFTFISGPVCKVKDDRTHNQNSLGAACRAVGANGFSTVGNIINPLSGYDRPFELCHNGVNNWNVKSDQAGGGKTKYNIYGPYDKKDPLNCWCYVQAGTKKIYRDGFEVFVGHGYDTQTLTSKAVRDSGGTISSKSFGQFPRKLKVNGDSTTLEPIIDNPYGVYINDPLAGVMHGGTTHSSGCNGWVSKNKTIPEREESEYTFRYDSEPDRLRYACMCGFNGGPPGSVGITGSNVKDVEYAGNTSNAGITRGKGSPGGYLYVDAVTIYSAKFKTVIPGGDGASFSIADLDGYNGGQHHADMTDAKKALRYPAKRPSGARAGGFGYYGGGFGGGGAAIIQTSAGGDAKGRFQNANYANQYQGGAIVVIAYLGSYIDNKS